MSVPAGLEWMRGDPRGAAWLDALPAVIARCAERWGLEVGEPCAASHVAWVARVALPDGTPAVLKIQLPDRESEHEAAALAAWGGDGAVGLLAAEAADHALLLECADPGEHLSTRSAPEALEVIAGLLERLWVPTRGPFTSLADEAALWAEELPATWVRAGRPFDRRLLDEARELMTALAATQVESVLLHQDLHADNVLSSTREPWLVIDPKPLVGERAFGLAPVIRSSELGHSRADVLHRLDFLSHRLGVDRDRARGWALAQTLAWAFDGDRVLPRHLETATWLSAS